MYRNMLIENENQCVIIRYEFTIICIPYLHEKRPMGGAPYIGPTLGDGPIFEVPLSQLDAKERPGKLPRCNFLFWNIGFSLVHALRMRVAGFRADPSRCRWWQL